MDSAQGAQPLPPVWMSGIRFACPPACGNRSAMNQTDTSRGAPLVLDGFAPLAELYDALICDLCGLLHDFVRAFLYALECLDELHRKHKCNVVLSNSTLVDAQ